MASTSFADTTEPAKKRAKTSEIGLDSSSKISQNPFELELKTSPTSKNRPESNGNSRSRSPQSWFLPSSEVSAMSGDDPDPDSGFESTTPQAYSEDSQEAISRKITDQNTISASGVVLPSTSTGSTDAAANTTIVETGMDSGEFRIPDSSVISLSQEEESLLEDAVDLNLPNDTLPVTDMNPGTVPIHASGSDPHPDLPDVIVEDPGDIPTPPNISQEDEDDRLSNISGLSDLSGSDWKPMAGPFSWVQRQMMSGADPRELLKDMISCDTVIPDHLDPVTLWKIILNMVSEPPRRKKLPEINTLADVVELIRKSQKIIILTGAGVSVSCGIPDFRSRNGIYARLAVDFPDLPDPQAMFDIHYFRKDPRPFFKFAKEIYPGQFEPSPCHKFIKSVENHGKLLRNYTQNIDTLEQVVGIKNVVQCHGSFATATCMICKTKVEAEVIREDIFAQKIPHCQVCELKKDKNEQQPNTSTSSISPPQISEVQPSGDAGVHPAEGVSQPKVSDPANNLPDQDQPGVVQQSSDVVPQVIPSIMKPDIVFFGEGLGDEFHNAVAKDKDNVDLLIMIGSSLKVRPVALIPSSINTSVPQILINREPLPHLTPDVELLGDCDGIINQICHMLGDGWEGPIHTEPMEEISILQPKHEEKSKENKNTDHTNVEEESTTNNSNENTAPKELTNEELAKMWEPKTRQSIAQRLKSNEYLFVSPNRYVFPGAEVYDKEDDSDSSSGNSDSDTDSDDEASDEDPNRISGPDPKPEGSTEQSASLLADTSANTSANAQQIPTNNSSTSQPQSSEVGFSKSTENINPTTLEKTDDQSD